MDVTRNALTRVADPSYLIPVLKARLPESCVIFNQIKSFHIFKDELEVYVFKFEEQNDMLRDRDRETWILTKFVRARFRDWITISIPMGHQLEERPVPEDFTRSLKEERIIGWINKFTFLFPARTNVWNKFSEVAIQRQCRPVTIRPIEIFQLSQEKALELHISAPDDVVVKRLDPINGLNFYSKYPEYSIPASDPLTRKALEHLPSGGVFLKEGGRVMEEPVSGVIMPGFGIITMSHTDQSHEGKGYTDLVMKFMIKELAKEGLSPCLSFIHGEGDRLGDTRDFINSVGMTWIGAHYLVSN